MRLVGRLLVAAVTAILLALAVDISVGNTGFVALDIWILDATVELPVWLLVLGCFVSGVVLGAVAMLVPLARSAWQKRQLRSRIGKLEKDAAETGADGGHRLPGP